MLNNSKLSQKRTWLVKPSISCRNIGVLEPAIEHRIPSDIGISVVSIYPDLPKTAIQGASWIVKSWNWVTHTRNPARKIRAHVDCWFNRIWSTNQKETTTRDTWSVVVNLSCTDQIPKQNHHRCFVVQSLIPNTPDFEFWGCPMTSSPAALTGSEALNKMTHFETPTPDIS